MKSKPLIGIFISLCVVIIVGVAYAAPSAKLRSLVLKPGDGVLVQCNGGTISTETDGDYQVFVWCNSVPVPPTKTPVPPTDTDTPAPPTDTDTPAPPTDTPAPPTATNTPGEPPTGDTYYLRPGESFGSIDDLLGPGDRVVLLAGVHDDSLLITNVHGSADAPIIVTGQLDADGDFATVLDGGYIRVRNSTHLMIRDLEAVGSTSRHGIEADPDSAGAKLTQDITFRHIYVHDLVGGDGNGTICLQVDNEPNTEGVFDILVEDYRCERNAPQYSSRDTVGVYLGDWPGTYPAPFAPIENVVLRDVWLEDIGTACVDMKPNLDGVLIERMTCLRSGNPTQNENGILIRGKNVTVRDSLVEDVGIGYSCSGCTGIRLTDYAGWVSENVLIENNTVRNGTGSVGIGGSSTYYWHGHNVVSRNNTVTGFGGDEYWGYGLPTEACDRVGQECLLLR